MLERRSNFSVTVLEDRLVVAGGYKKEPGEEVGAICREVEVYCPVTNRCGIHLHFPSLVTRWSRGPALQVARSALKAVSVPRANLL